MDPDQHSISTALYPVSLTLSFTSFDRDCLGVIGCEWCQAEQVGERDRDGKIDLQPIRQPFCSSQITCFGGVIGAQTPYGERPQGIV